MELYISLDNTDIKNKSSFNITVYWKLVYEKTKKNNGHISDQSTSLTTGICSTHLHNNEDVLFVDDVLCLC